MFQQQSLEHLAHTEGKLGYSQRANSQLDSDVDGDLIGQNY
jgi:hypothetical protein